MALAARDRQVEENVRMLAGQQWIVWNDRFQRFVDIAEILDEEQAGYRQRPVVNRLLYWFVLNHARMTENPPIIAFEPATSDHVDAELAAGMDILSKSLWDDLGMEDIRSRLKAWMLVGGRGYLYTRVDPTKGEPEEFYGPAVVNVGGQEQLLVDPETGQPAQVPYAPNDQGEFVPQVNVGPDGSIEFGDAWKEHEGGLDIVVHGPLEIRFEWGNDVPFHKKGWHMRKTIHTPDEVWEMWGVRCEADKSLTNSGVGQMERLLRGTGHFGAAKENVLDRTDTTAQDDPAGLVEVIELWVRPGHHGTPKQTDDDPGGRLLVVAGDKVIRDGTRPAPYRYTSPLRAFDMIMTPGSPHGRSPLEWLNPIQRLYNRTWGQLLEHTNLVANPILVVDHMANVPEITNAPGMRYTVNRRAGTPPLEFVAPPSLSKDVYNQLDLLGREFEDLGNIAGAEGRVPHDRASGNLMEELRFNSDRFLGAPLRRSAEEYGRFWEDVMSTLEVLWDREKVVEWMGEDSVLRTITIGPEMWQGRVNVKPVMDAMLPESRQEKRQRVRADWLEGAFGDPLSPQARRRYLDLANYPHMDRATIPGGIDWETSRYVLGLIAKGENLESIRLYPWYDLEVWVASADEYMSTPEFLRLDPEIQERLSVFREMIRAAAMEKQYEEAVEGASLEAQVMRAGQEAQLAAGVPQLEAAAAEALAPEPGPEGSEPTPGPSPS